MHSGRTFLYIFLLFPCFIFGIRAEDNGGARASFERLGPYGGDVRSLLMDAQQPSIVYLGTSSGKIYKSTDGGGSWAVLNPGIGRNGFVVDTLIQHPAEQDKPGENEERLYRCVLTSVPPPELRFSRNPML